MSLHRSSPRSLRRPPPPAADIWVRTVGRWLDDLEFDVLVGGSAGVPGLCVASVMGGVCTGDADTDTGRRERNLTGYVMPAIAIGGYGKLDADYSRRQGLRVSGGGGIDFFGVWGGPGGQSWGNIFAAGAGIPLVINVGAGYGVKDGQPYGALILSTYWPPFSTTAVRVDTVARHPALAVAAKRIATRFKGLLNSRFIACGRGFIASLVARCRHADCRTFVSERFAQRSQAARVEPGQSSSNLRLR